MVHVTKQRMVSTLQWLIIGKPVITHDAKKWITSAHLNGWLFIGKPMSQCTLYAAMFCPLHSSIIIYRTTWKTPLQSIQLLRKILKIHSWSMRPISQCMKAITPRFNNIELISQHFSCEKGLSKIFAPHWSHYTLTANRHLYVVVKKEWGTKGFKGSTMMQTL